MPERVGKILISAAISLMIKSFVEALVGEENTSDSSPASGVRQTFSSTQAPVPIVYGEMKVGGNDVYYATSENTLDLWIVQTLAEGVCNGLKQVYDPGNNLVSAAYLGEHLYNWYTFDGSPHAAIYFHSGTLTQTVETNLSAIKPEWTDCLRGTSYLIWKLTYNPNLYTSIPTRTCILQGKVVYDFRDLTWKYSNNPVLCLYDYMTNKRYGTGYASTYFDIATWTSAANYCDTKGWKLNLVFSSDSRDAASNIDLILSHFRGTLKWWDGKFYLGYRDLGYESSVMTLTDAHIVRDANGKALISLSQPNRGSKPKGLRVKFYDPDKDYILDDIPIGDPQGELRDYTNLIGAGSRANALNLGNYALERLLLDRKISGVFRDDCMKLDPGDPVTLSASCLGIADQELRVIDSNLRPDGFVDLSMEFEDEEMYDDDLDPLIDQQYRCDLPRPNETPPSVQNVETSETGFDYRLRTFTKLAVNFDAPDYLWYDGVDVWKSTDDVTYVFAFHADSSFEIENVLEGQDYYLILCTTNIYGVKQSLTQGYKLHALINGHTQAPSSLASLSIIPNDNSLILMANPLNESDIESYEFRFGSSWSTAIFIASTLKPFYSLKGIKPGSFTFWCNTKGNNGVYGDTPRSASCTITAPKGWTALDSDFCDYTSGNFNNSAHTTYNSEDYLIGQHGFKIPSNVELLTNGGFDSDTTGWTPENCSLASVIGGQFGNCLQMTRSSGDYQSAIQTITTVVGRTYIYEAYVKSGTSGNELFYLQAYDTGGQIAYTSGISSSSWTKYVMSFTARYTSTLIYLNKVTATAGTMLFDSASVHLSLVTNGNFEADPNTNWTPTGCTIASVAGGVFGNCLQMTYVSGGGQYAAQYISGLTIGKRYQFDVYVKDGTCTDHHAYFGIWDGSELAGTYMDATGSWVKHSLSWIADRTAVTILIDKYSSASGTILFDEVDFYEVEYNLVGVYTSPEYDIGSIQSVLLYIATEIVQIGEGTTWADKFPSPTTWAEGGIVGKTWLDMFELTSAPSIGMKIYYGDTSGALTNCVDRMELLSAVLSGRYFKVEITITDPSINVNALIKEFTLYYLN